MAQPSSVYDPEADEQPVRHQLPGSETGRAANQTTPAGDSSDPRASYDPQKSPMGDSSDPRGDLRKAEGGDGLFNPGGDEDTSSAGLGAAGLAAAEGQASDNFSFNPQDKGQRGNLKLVMQAAGRRRKGLVIGGGAAGGIIGLVVVGFFILIPLKIEHIVDNLQNRFFATSENAVGNETENMLSTYVKKYVLPTLTTCHGTSIDKNCNPKFGTSSNPVTALYSGWSNARLENKLASDYGIEFRAVKHGSVYKYYMKAPGIKNPNGDDITSFASAADNKDLFQEVSRGSVRQSVRDALQNETQWKQVMYRYKVGRLLEEKYGIKRCIIFCGTQDALKDFTSQKKNAAQIFLTQRVIVPRTQSLGIVMECILDPSCEPESSEPTTPQDGTTGELEGAPENAGTDTAVRTNLEQLAQSYGITDDATIKQMVQDYTDISEKGYQQYALNAVLEKLGLSEFSDSVSDAVPVVGWVTTGSQLISGVNKIGPSVRKLGYVVNSGAAVSMYMTYRTFADEIHTGHVDPTEVGSMVSSLGPGNPGSSTDPEVGGTASAESAPIYNSVINDSGSPDSTPTSMLDNILPAKAYADASADTSDSSSNFVCKDGKPVPAGKLVCPEEVLGQGNSSLDAVHSFLNLPGISIITTIANAISHISGIIGGLLGIILHLIPGISSVSQLISKALNPVFSDLTNQLIPNPFGSNMSGGSKVTMMAGGAAVAGNDSCEQIGCQSVSPVAYMNVVNQQQAEGQQQFADQPLFARMFSTDSQYSLVSRIAVDMPTDVPVSMEASFTSILSDPFGTIAHSFGSLFPGKQASAASASTADIDPFQVGTTAFPDNKIPADPQKYWDTHNCGDTSSSGPIAKWQQAAANGPTDPNTGEPMHTTVEPCLLIQNSVADGGGALDSSLLSSDDLADQSGGSGGTTTPSPTTTAGATIDLAHLYDDSTGVACAANTKDIGVYDGYTNGTKVKIRLCAISNLPSSGEEANGGYGVSGAAGKCPLNSRVSGAVYAMVQAAQQSGVTLTTDSCYRTMAHQIALQGGGAVAAPPGYSNHQMGLAMDFSVPICSSTISGQCSDPGNSMWDWLSKNASNFGYKSGVPSEAWHWSPTGN